MRKTLLAAAALCALAGGAANAEMSGGTVKIGVLNDMSGLYADLSGQGSVIAAQMALEEFGGNVNGTKVEIVSADHQNKPDIGSNVARQWYDVDGVDVIVDVPTSSVALAINDVTREKNKVFLVSGAAASDLTGPKCSPNTIHWTYDTWALANGTGKAVVQTGGDSWFFLTADYAFGHALERDTTAVVEANGGKVLGSVRHPLNNADFSSFLLQAQSSGAKVIGLANAGGDTTNSIKQAAEFGIVSGGQSLAGLLVFLTDVHALGLETAQGLIQIRGRLREAQPRHPSDDGACRRLLLGAALPQGAEGAGSRRGRRCGCRQDERDADRRPSVRQGRGPRRRAAHSPDVSVRGEEAGGVEGRLGLLQAAGHHSGRGGLPATRQGGMPAREELI
jgi:ABC-type branched-subunit amino acid transport system substrate-binding protein